jgi:hypothetical protein
MNALLLKVFLLTDQRKYERLILFILFVRLVPVIIPYTKRFDSINAFLTYTSNSFIFLSSKEELAVSIIKHYYFFTNYTFLQSHAFVACCDMNVTNHDYSLFTSVHKITLNEGLQLYVYFVEQCGLLQKM